MYKINKLHHGRRFVRDFHTRWFCIRNLTRSISDTSPTRVKIPYARAFHEVISILLTEAYSNSVIARFLKENVTLFGAFFWLQSLKPSAHTSLGLPPPHWTLRTIYLNKTKPQALALC